MSGGWLRLAKMLLLLPGLALCGADSPGRPIGDRLAGPITAFVERVIDGDTFTVRAQIWLRQEVEVDVRPRGIDAPEIRTACRRERLRGEAARDYLESLIAGKTVVLTEIEGDKYHGRIDATVRTADGKDVSEAMLASGTGVEVYDGGRRRSLCS